MPGELNLHQTKFLELARALASRPRLLMLDEVLSGLTPAEIDGAVDLIRRIRDRGTTIILVEHVMRVGDRAVRSHRGAGPGTRASPKARRPDVMARDDVAVAVLSGSRVLEIRDLRVCYGAAPALWGVSLAMRAGELALRRRPQRRGQDHADQRDRRPPGASAANAHDGRTRDARCPRHIVSAVQASRSCPRGGGSSRAMSVRENLEVGSYLRAARAASARQLAGMRLRAVPRCCATSSTRAPASLSGGQQQMVAIGRALMARPRLLLLDEPSLGLSPAMVHGMFRAIREVHAAGTAVLLVEQNVAEALDIADRAYLLEEGRIVAEGAPRRRVPQSRPPACVPRHRHRRMSVARGLSRPSECLNPA